VVNTWAETEGTILGWLNDANVGGLKDLGRLGTEAVKALATAASERCEGFVLSVETGAGVEWLKGWGLHDGTLEERINSSSLGDEVVHDGSGAGRLTHGGDLSLITVEETNVVLNPLKGSPLIMNTKVSNTFSLWDWSVQPSESTELFEYVSSCHISTYLTCTYSVVWSNPDDVVLRNVQEWMTIVKEERLGAHSIASTKDPEENWEVLGLTTNGLARNTDIKEQAILRRWLQSLKEWKTNAEGLWKSLVALISDSSILDTFFLEWWLWSLPSKSTSWRSGETDVGKMIVLDTQSVNHSQSKYQPELTSSDLS
jgi:hypothetical protein